MTMHAFSHTVVTCLALVVSFTALVRSTAPQGIAQFSALAVNQLSTTPGAGTTPVNIVVTRWTTDAERESLITTLLEGKADALRVELARMPAAGSIAAPGSTGIELRYARRELNADGTERVVLVTDRPMSFWERQDAGRSTDYPFTVIELRLQPNGEGEGKVSVATRIAVSKNERLVVLENYEDQPVGLRAVKRLPTA
jgi:hypothetical protein